MTVSVQRTADQVMECLNRALVKDKGAGGNKAIGTSAPTANSVPMGRTSQSCILSLRVETITGGGPANVILWLRDGPKGSGTWFKGGANSNVYQKSFEEGCGDAFVVIPGAAYFLQGSAEITTCRVCDGGEIRE